MARPRAGLSPADRFVLRIAVAATLGFAIAMLLDWEFSFLAPMLAVQLVAAIPISPPLRLGVAIPLVMFLATTAAFTMSALLSDAHVVLICVTAVVICWSFYAQRRGAPAVMMLFVQIAFCGVPLMSSVSLDIARDFAKFLQLSSMAAIATVWFSHALFPAPAPPPRPAGAPAPAKPAGLPPADAAKVAISDTLVLMPLLTNFMMGGEINNFVALMITINLLREVEVAQTGRVAAGLLAGNILGGVLAVLLQQFVLLSDNIVLFLMTVFLVGLWFGARLVRGGPKAPIFALAFGTFILLIGIAITPLPGGSEEMFAIRILKVAAASAYTLGALSLVAWLRRRRAGAPA